MTVKNLSVNAISITLHGVVTALDRSGDRILRAELGISHSRAVLLLVVDRDGPLSQAELARHLGCTEPAVTGLLREVIRSGYVDVAPDALNRRTKLVSLTAKGKSMVNAASTLLHERFAALLSRAEVDGKELLVMLMRIADTLAAEGSN